MKLQICNPKEKPLNGYLIKSYDKTLFEQGVDDGEVDEILASNIVNYLKLSNIENLIEDWVNKLRVGGRIILGGTDSFEVTRNYFNFIIDTEEFNQLLFDGKTCSFSCKDIADYLKDKFNLKIMKKRIENYNYIVEAIKQ